MECQCKPEIAGSSQHNLLGCGVLREKIDNVHQEIYGNGDSNKSLVTFSGESGDEYEAAVIDVSMPDQPFVPMYTDPMSPSSWGGRYISADGANNCLFSDSVIRLSYVTDTNFHVRDVFCSEYSWYRYNNYITLQGYNCLPRLTSPL